MPVEDNCPSGSFTVAVRPFGDPHYPADIWKVTCRDVALECRHFRAAFKAAKDAVQLGSPETWKLDDILTELKKCHWQIEVLDIPLPDLEVIY